MKVAIFSDIHGNLPALERMLADAGEVDKYICLGDIVNYGPWSNECVDRIFGLPNVQVLMGNHEAYFRAGEYQSKSVSKAFFDVCLPGFDRQEQIANLPESHEWEGYTFTHTIEDRNIYPDSDVVLDANYVIGHSHHQFKKHSNGFVLYNAGSVGQNRLYINIVNYLLFYPRENRFELKSVAYDERLIIDEMRRLNYPPECVDYYDQKKRLRG